jgi:hypothetical protein
MNSDNDLKERLNVEQENINSLAIKEEPTEEQQQEQQQQILQQLPKKRSQVKIACGNLQN